MCKVMRKLLRGFKRADSFVSPCTCMQDQEPFAGSQELLLADDARHAGVTAYT